MTNIVCLHPRSGLRVRVLADKTADTVKIERAHIYCVRCSSYLPDNDRRAEQILSMLTDEEFNNAERINDRHASFKRA